MFGDELMLLDDRIQVNDPSVTTITAIVTVDPEGQVPDQLRMALQDLDIDIEAEFVFERWI